MASGENSKTSKLLWLSILPARLKKIHPKMKALAWSQHFSHFKYIGIFQDAQGQLSPKFLVGSEPIQDYTVDLVTYKNKENPIKCEVTRVVTSFPLL